MMQENQPGTEVHRDAPGLPVLLLYAIGLGVYFVLRFGGGWIEIDTSRLTQSAQAVLETSALAPPGRTYLYGFNYPVLVAWLAHLTGFSVLQLQTTVLPLVGVFSAAMAGWVFFATVLGKKSSATLAALMICLQADFLFVTARGSHEKLTWPLALVALFALYRSARQKLAPAQFAAYMAVFYLAIFAMIATNVFFASTLITAIVVSLFLGLAIRQLWSVVDRSADGLLRLALVSAAGTALLFVFLFYLYPASMTTLYVLPTVIDKMAALFLGFEPQGNPYAYIRWGWISPKIYFALSLFTWLLLLGSLAEWLRQARRFVLGERLLLPGALPWLLYAGFAVQVALGMLLDFAGILSLNLQLRLLPGLVIFGVVLAVQGLEHLLSLAHPERRTRRILYGAAAGLVLWFSLASLLKATNDPLVSNKWGFYHPTERAALRWAAAHTDSAHVWAGVDERLSALYSVLVASRLAAGGMWIDIGEVQEDTRYLIFSETERLRHSRLGADLPAAILEDRIYDAGWAELYRKRPRTPYQNR